VVPEGNRTSGRVLDQSKAGDEASDFHSELDTFYLVAPCSEREASLISQLDLIIQLWKVRMQIDWQACLSSVEECIT